MNRLSTENLVEPINKDLEFQLQDPFLLYRNGNLGIYSIWFYDKRDCHRIAQLMVKIVKQEADLAQRESPERVEAVRSNGVTEPRPIDILELLSKAKEEYQRTQTGDTDVSTAAEPKAAINTTGPVHSTPQPEKHSHIVKQITVEELFGSSLPKDPTLPAMPASNPPLPPTAIHNQAYPTVAVNPLLPPQLHQAPAIIPAPYNIHPSPVFQSMGPRPDIQPHCPISPLAPSHPPAPQQTPPGAVLGQEILNSLKPIVNTDMHKPILAPNFLPSTLFPPQSFREPMGKQLLQHNKEMDVFNQTPNLVKPMSAVSMSPALNAVGTEASLLLSPSVFQQSISKPSLPPSSSSSSSVHTETTPTADTQPAPCTKTQLQDTLIHLIKNDPDFLSAIHDAYLQSVSKDLSNMKL